MEPILEFPADLTKKEYIDFSVGLTGGKGHKAYLFLMLMCTVLGIFMGVEENWSYESIAIIAVSVLTGVVTAFGIPLYSRRKAAGQYDTAVQGGYDFHGIVRFYDDRVEKICCGDVNTVRYSEATFFENEHMMVFAVRGGRSLVLPARCTTEADAEAVRSIVRAHIPAQRQLLRHRMYPRATERIAPPVGAELPEEQELLTFTAQHTVQSFAKQARRQASRRFTATLPMTLVLDVLLSLLLGVLYGFIAGVALFIAALAVPWLMQVVVTGNRAKRAAEAQDEAALRIRVTVTDRGVRIHAFGTDSDGFVSWKTVARAVEGREAVDFIGHDGQALLSLPISAIGEHMDALRTVVTDRMRRAKGEADE